MAQNPKRPMARLGLGALALCLLSPMVVHGLFRPLAQILGANGNALHLTFAALAVAALAFVGYLISFHRGPHTPRPTLAAASGALLLGLLLGHGAASIAAAVFPLLAVALFAGKLLPWIVERLPQDMDALAKRRYVVTTLVILLSMGSIHQMARLSTFMGDSSRGDLSALPTLPLLVNHSCLTAYVEGTRLAAEGAENIYDAKYWPDLQTERTIETAFTGRYAPFGLDTFEYPPAFLLLPHILLSWLPDYASQRALWFGFNGLLLAAGLWVVAAWIGGRTEVRALLAVPIIFISFPTLLVLQVGNVHVSVIVLSVLAMVAFERKRYALGGAMLAFTIASKISPGLLILMLLIQRRFREVLWTAGFGAGFVLLTTLVFGLGPIQMFLFYQLPHLASGEALRFLAWEQNLPVNLAPFGLPFKLAYLGMNVGDPWKLAKLINHLFTAMILVLTVIAARKQGGARVKAELWLSVLALGTLRSPLAPAYAMVPLFWLFSLLSTEVRGPLRVFLISAIWVFLGTAVLGPFRQLLIGSIVQQFLLLGLLVYVVLRRPYEEAADLPRIG